MGQAAGWSVADKGEQAMPGPSAGKFRSHVPGGRRQKSTRTLNRFLGPASKRPFYSALKTKKKKKKPCYWFKFFGTFPRRERLSSRKGC